MPRGKRITKEQGAKISELAYRGLSTRDISSEVKLHYSAVAKYLRNEGIKPDIGNAVTETLGLSLKYGNKDTYVFTWAQNATPAYTPFYNSIQTYCQYNKAHLRVIPGRYKNPTSVWTESQQNEQWWDSRLEPFLTNQRCGLNDNLMTMSDISIQPTAALPLMGMESMSHGLSAIFGHPKLALRSIATPHQRLPKVITTTGAITVPNYTASKAGKKGEFHHVYGALVVELINDKIFHMRHINARQDGAFCDKDKAYFADGKVKAAGAYPGVVFGDTHVGATDPAVLEASFGNLIDVLNPKQLVFNDLFDAYSITAHHDDNPFIRVAKRKTGRDDLSAELMATVQFLKEYTKGRDAVIVPSNHDDMFARWMRRVDWRHDPTNAETYLETALHMVRTLKMSNAGAEIADPFKYWIGRANLKNVKMLTGSHTIKGIEVGLHGHQGPDGVRGSLMNLSRLGTKVITGHSHRPGIEGGNYQCGTMTPLRLEYTGPISSWLHTHCSIDPFGKRHLHTFVNGGFWR